MFDSGDSAVFWLNVTNISLGLAVLGFLVLVLYSAVRDIWSAGRTRARAPQPECSQSERALEREFKGVPFADPDFRRDLADLAQ